MKLFIVTARMMKKRRKTILLLMAEMILSSVVMASLVGQMLFIHKSSRIVNAFNGFDCYYFTPHFYYDPDFYIGDYLSDEEKASTELGTTHIMSVKTEQHGLRHAVGYTDFVIDRACVEMEEGDWFNTADCSNIPLVAVGDEYKTGEQVTFENGSTGTIIGTVRKDSYIISFTHSGSSGNASLSDFISLPSEAGFIVPYQSEHYQSLPEEVIEHDMANFSQIVYIRNPDMKSRVTGTLKQYGYISSIEEMENNFNEENRDYFITNGIIFFIFMILTVVGIGGINGIWRVEDEHAYTVMYILGLDTKKCMVIEALKTFTVVGISYLFFLAVYRWLLDSVLPVGISAESGWIPAVTFLYFLVIYAVSSASSILNAGKHNVMELYRRKE